MERNFDKLKKDFNWSRHPLFRDEVKHSLYDPNGDSSQPLHRICGGTLKDHFLSADVKT